MRDVIIRENLIPENVCNNIIMAHKTKMEEGYFRIDDSASGFDGRVLDWRDAPSNIQKNCWIFGYSFSGILSTFYDEGPIYPETIHITKWSKGDELPLHGDAEYYPDGNPNYCSWRSHSMVLFLNNIEVDFTGGEFFFHSGLHVSPSTGTIVGFDSSIYHAHGGRPVLSGDRYTVAFWYTMDKNKRLF